MLDIIGTTLMIAIFAYAIGSIPFGLIFTQLGGAGDIRDIGSGNIGATNVLRTGSKKLAVLTLLFDAGKGAAAVYLASYWAGSTLASAASAIAAIMVVIGHCFPVWLKFKGGKGVATSLAVMAMIDLRLGGVFIAVWLLTAALSRYSSLSALLAVLSCAMASVILIDAPAIHIAVITLGGIIFSRHHANIRRLLNGTETKVGTKSTSENR